MGFLGGLLGVNNQNSNIGIRSAPTAQTASLQNPTLANPISAYQAQNSVNGANADLAQQQAFVNALQAQNGLQNQSSVYNQLQGVANGTGPNPAQAMLNQSTGQNVANQAALMAGQRGAGANAGLIARQAAQQGAATQQQAAGQAATMQANQSLNALGQLGGISGQEVNNLSNNIQGLTGAQQAQQGQLLGQVNTQNQQALQQANQMNQANLQQAGMLNNYNLANQQGLNQIASGAAQQNTGVNAGLVGGALGGLGSAGLGAVGLAEGGEVKHNGPKSKVGKHFHSVKSNKKVDALVSPGEIYLTPDKAKKVASGKVDPIKTGEKIPGKAKVAGNSYTNDTVPKKLEEGGIVLPRSVTESKHPHWAAHAFVKAVMARKKR